MPSRVTARWLFLAALVAVGCGLAGAAWAQAAEATQAVSKAADALLGQGPAGAVIVILLAAVGFLFWKLDRLSTSIMREAMTAFQANTAATAAGTVTIAALDRTLQATDDGVEKLSRQTELAAQEAKLRGEAILKNQEAILRRIDEEARRA